MNYMNIYPCAISDGPGVRVSLYVSGCRNHCINCHNKESWDFNAGHVFNEQTMDLLKQYLDHPYVRGLTICGGEPMEKENQEQLYNLLKNIKSLYPQKDIWCYTGYLYDDLLPGGKQNFNHTNDILAMIDVLIDGPFVFGQRDISDSNRWRGSKNQRVIDVIKSLKEHKIIPVEGIPNNNF